MEHCRRAGEQVRQSPLDLQGLRVNVEWPRRQIAPIAGLSQNKVVLNPSGAGRHVSSRFSEIARRTSEMRAEWEKQRPDNAEPTRAMESEGTLSLSKGRVSPTIVQPDPAALVAVERKYAPMFLNSRLRIMALKSQLASAESWQQAELERRMREAEAQLNAVDNDYRREIEAVLGR